HLYPPRRRLVDLGGAVERDHRLRSSGEGHDVRARGIQDLPASDVLRRAGRSRAYVTSLRGAQRRSNPEPFHGGSLDCFASLAMTNNRPRSRYEAMATPSIQVSETPLVLYALRRADDALILGHRLSEWCGHAPAMEEDMALSNVALDLIGQARELYTYAAEV